MPPPHQESSNIASAPAALPPSVSYTVRIGRLSWAELWVLGGRNPLGFALVLPAKLAGSRKYDQSAVMDFERPLGVGQPPPSCVPPAAVAQGAALEQQGFSFWGADHNPLLAVSALSYRRAGVLAQVVARDAGLHQVAPMTLLYSFTTPRLTITADSESGIRPGDTVDKHVAWNASPRELIALHLARTPGYNRAELTEDYVLARFAESSRAAFHYNLKRGVFELREKSDEQDSR